MSLIINRKRQDIPMNSNLFAGATTRRLPNQDTLITLTGARAPRYCVTSDGMVRTAITRQPVTDQDIVAAARQTVQTNLHKRF